MNFPNGYNEAAPEKGHMKKKQKEAILISFLNKKDQYKKLAQYIVRLIRDDPSKPEGSIHTITYRIKDELRLIEKIDRLNKDIKAGTPLISERDYQAFVGDLLGVRIICLRLSDVEKVEAYLKLLSEESILNFVRGPDHKKSFILPVNPDESIPDATDLRHTGYSSIHYRLKLGENSDAPQDLKGVIVELQLRTILEEAWSEIDHKYRYMRSRNDVELPDHIHAGFYNLSAYLQTAASQAEYLCRMADAYYRKHTAKSKRKASIQGVDELPTHDNKMNKALQEFSSPDIVKDLENILKIKVSLRTLIYIEKRLCELNFEKTRPKTLKHLFVKNRLVGFESIFQEVFNVAPFVNPKEYSMDVINALNFAIFYELQGKRVAQEGLKVVLRWRKDRLIL